MTWQEKLDFVTKNKHLPEVDPAKEMESNGLLLAKNFIGLLSNIEDNTMDIIELYKINMQQQILIKELKQINITLEKKYEELLERINYLETKL